MTAQNLGTLEEVNLREIWPHEANDFTPWLAENLGLLGDALGLQLKLAGTEYPCGGRFGNYRLDILAKTEDGEKVAIENQLEWTDHDHLGQVLTYAASCEAEYVVWVARHFMAGHRTALDWLNRLNPEKVWFYGVEVRVVRVGDSPSAVDFHVVAAPSDWWRTIPSSLE